MTEEETGATTIGFEVPRWSAVSAGAGSARDQQRPTFGIIRDVVATNTLGRAVLSPLHEDPTRPVNTARFRFLNPRAADYYLDWDRTGHDTVAGLRIAAGKNPYHKALTDLIGELCTRSVEFRTRWASHDVHLHRTGVKRVHHPTWATSSSPTSRSSCRPIPGWCS